MTKHFVFSANRTKVAMGRGLELIEHSCSALVVEFLVQCLTQLDEMIGDINVE